MNGDQLLQLVKLQLYDVLSEFEFSVLQLKAQLVCHLAFLQATLLSCPRMSASQKTVEGRLAEVQVRVYCHSLARKGLMQGEKPRFPRSAAFRTLMCYMPVCFIKHVGLLTDSQLTDLDLTVARHAFLCALMFCAVTICKMMPGH